MTSLGSSITFGTPSICPTLLVSSDGLIVMDSRFTRQYLIGVSANQQRYVIVNQRLFYVKRLVASAFLPMPRNRNPRVYNVDGNPANNCADNVAFSELKKNRRRNASLSFSLNAQRKLYREVQEEPLIETVAARHNTYAKVVRRVLVSYERYLETMEQNRALVGKLGMRPSRFSDELLVSEDGRLIVNLRTGRLCPAHEVGGQLSVSYRQKCYTVGSLVASAFLPPPSFPMERANVLHVDGNALNCHFSNLVYIDRKSSAVMDSCKKRGTMRKGFCPRDKRGLVKLTVKDVRAVWEAYKSGVRVSELARRYGVSTTTLYSALKAAEADEAGRVPLK